MKRIFGFILYLSCVYILNAQSLPVRSESIFTLKGSVLLDNKKSLEDFDILVNVSPYTNTNEKGEFRI